MGFQITCWGGRGHKIHLLEEYKAHSRIVKNAKKPLGLRLHTAVCCRHTNVIMAM